MISKKKISAAVLTAVLSGSSAWLAVHPVQSTSAYFTDNESHTNSYAMGNITIDGTESEWNPENAKAVVPKMVIAKNPRLENTGTNAAVGFIVLDSPLLHQIQLSDDHGALLPPADVETFRFLNAEKVEGFNIENWVLLDTGYLDYSGNVISKENEDVPEQAEKKRYIFGYKNALPGGNAEAPIKTDPLFNWLESQNYVEGSIPDNTPDGIDVHFLAIQADYLTLPDGAVTSEASLQNMSTDTLRAVYQIVAAKADFRELPEADTSNHLNLKGTVRSSQEGAQQ